MKHRYWSLIAALALAPGAASAQGNQPATVTKPAGVAPAAAAASKPLPSRPPPNPESASEKVEGVPIPGDVRPERPVEPQLKIPVGKTAPQSSTSKRNTKSPAAGGVNDAAARCLSEETEAARADCKQQASRGAPPR